MWMGSTCPWGQLGPQRFLGFEGSEGEVAPGGRLQAKTGGVKFRAPLCHHCLGRGIRREGQETPQIGSFVAVPRLEAEAQLGRQGACGFVAAGEQRG